MPLGRTNPTYRDALQAIEDQWQQYRRALRRRDQNHFDRLFEHARAHADAASYLNHQQPEIMFLVSVVLEQEKQIQDLTRRVDALENDLNNTDDDTGSDTTQPERDRSG